MADFTADFQSLKLSFPFMDMDPNSELMTQIAGLNPILFDNSLPLSNDIFSFANQITQIPQNLTSFPSLTHHSSQISCPVPDEPIFAEGIEEIHGTQKRKAINLSESSSKNSSPQVSENGLHRKNSSGRGKRVKGNDKEDERPKEVVHVRARRGQATDSHSIAERARRGKINERLRHLQDIVPGCYKTMGMAVMLDEIINYVQSLQNQVEFLSMKLTAASSFYDFNSEADVIEKMQKEKANEAKELERLMRSEGYGGLLGSTQSWPI